MHAFAVLIRRQHALDVVGGQVFQESPKLVPIADVDAVTPVGIHQPVVHLLVPAEVTCEFGQAQRVE